MLLCGNETRRFQDLVERSGMFTDLIDNNAGKNKCTANTFETKAHAWSHDNCTISWNDTSLRDKFKFNSYIIQYVPIKSTKVLEDNMLFERDSCSSYGWQHAYLKLNNSQGGLIEYNLTGLHQFTIYAYTVQTYQYGEDEINFMQTNTENDGAISQKGTFHTLMRMPSRVKNFKTKSQTWSTIQLQWSVTDNEEAAIEFFHLDIKKKPFNVELIDRRNYCINPIRRTEAETIEKVGESESQELSDDDQPCCDKCCQMDEEEPQMSDSDFQTSLEKFGDQVPRSDFEIDKNKGFTDTAQIKKTYRNFTIENLDPFTLYSFYLYACSGDYTCSDYELHSEMTLMNEDESYEQVNLLPSNYLYESRKFSVYFEEPTNKNGVIISYITQLREIVKNTSIHLSTDCITRLQHQINDFKCV